MSTDITMTSKPMESTKRVITSKKKESLWQYMQKHWQLYIVFLMPAFLLTVIFKYLPMGGILIAFQDFNPMKGIVGSTWTGFENFTRFFNSPDFMSYLANTLKLSIYGLLWGFPVPIILALLLNRLQNRKLKSGIQMILYMPNFISVIVLCGMVRILLSVNGPINMLFHSSINFMTMPEAFRSIYIISGIWQGAGWASIMYTASLSNASHELREAAIIDGANIWQQMKVVDWPAIKGMVVIQFILSAGNIMSIGFEKAYALQTDLNNPTSEIIATYVYKKGLLEGNYSFSTAVGLFNTIINVVLLIVVNKIVSKMNDGQGI
nr:ABC transporter permease subunit [Lachnobacterium bovis]